MALLSGRHQHVRRKQQKPSVGRTRRKKLKKSHGAFRDPLWDRENLTSGQNNSQHRTKPRIPEKQRQSDITMAMAHMFNQRPVYQLNQGCPNVRPVAQNWPTKGSEPAHRKKMTRNILTIKAVKITFSSGSIFRPIGSKVDQNQ